jgi:hypothetical protein
MRKKWVILIGFMVFTIFSSGCSGIKKSPVEKVYFDLNITDPALTNTFVSQGNILLVKNFTVNPVFDSHGFVYRIGKNKYVTDYYNEFLSAPARLITDKTAENLYSSSHFTSASGNMQKEIDYRLSGKITSLYGDFQDSKHPKAIIELRITLEKNTGSSFELIHNKTYYIKENIISQEPDQLITGWNKGLIKIVSAFIADFRRYPNL